MPDNSVVTVKGELRITAPELLFQPYLGEIDCPTLPETVQSSIQKAEMDLRVDLCKSMVLIGGNTMFDGLADRLQAELAALLPQEVNVEAGANRTYEAWVGASVMAQKGLQAMITKSEYAEIGAQVINQRCM